jgi:hypothetical protein
MSLVATSTAPSPVPSNYLVNGQASQMLNMNSLVARIAKLEADFAAFSMHQMQPQHLLQE